MILIDSRAGNIRFRDQCKELQAYVQRIGVKADMTQLEFGDACFEGNGPKDPNTGAPTKILIGIERKQLGDMLNCIDDSRYVGHQRPGMLNMYGVSILMVEGVWKPDTTTGYMMEIIAAMTWRPFRYRTMAVRYNKLFRYLLGIQLGGTMVILSRDLEHTAYNICECYHYFQKKWDDHTSLLEMQKLNLPELRGRPTTVRQWAASLEGIGVKLSLEVEKVFKTPYNLAHADEEQWIQVPGVNSKMARKLVKIIRGW